MRSAYIIREKAQSRYNCVTFFLYYLALWHKKPPIRAFLTWFYNTVIDLSTYVVGQPGQVHSDVDSYDLDTFGHLDVTR